jgi:hypothetical protein
LKSINLIQLIESYLNRLNELKDKCDDFIKRANDLKKVSDKILFYFDYFNNLKKRKMNRLQLKKKILKKEKQMK